MADFDAVIALDPNNAAAYSNRADVFIRKGEYDRAIADYDKIIEINPRLQQTYVNRSIAYFKNHRYASGVVSFVQGTMMVQK